MDTRSQQLVDSIITKFKKYNIIDEFEKLRPKEKEQLISIEKYVQKCTRIKKKSIRIYKGINLSKSNISGKLNNLARQTIYNNKTIKDYIEKSIIDFINTFYDTDVEIEKYKSLEKSYHEIKELLDSSLISIIEFNELKLRCNKLEEDNLKLQAKVNALVGERAINVKIINDLERNIRDSQNKVTGFKRAKM